MTEGAIKHEQSRDSGIIGHKRRSEYKKNTTWKTKKTRNTVSIEKSRVGSDAHKGYTFAISYKTSAVLLIVKSDRSLLGDTGKKNFYLKGKTSLLFVKWVFR